MKNKNIKILLMVTFIITIVISSSILSAGECKAFIELHSAKYLANEYGQSELWVLNNVRINLWEKQTPHGKGKKVGELLPGSRALIIEIGPEDYKVRSPYDKSIGWVNKIQLRQVIKLDPITYELCN